MKLINYQLQTQIENLGEDKSKRFFTDYIHNILEDDSKPYYQKADYVGLSLNTLKSKIDYLSEDIKELQQFKKKLSSALDIGKEITAKVFIENGIDRIDGNIISSLTLTKPSSKTKNTLIIKDEQALLQLGYVKFELDTEAIEKDLTNKEKLTELNKYVSISSDTVNTPAKVKINTKRTSINTQADELLNIVDQKLAA